MANAANTAATGSISSGSPIYDVILLGYAQELSRKRRQRNALIVVTDGLDNQFGPDGIGHPSEISFPDLHRAAAEMDHDKAGVLGRAIEMLIAWADANDDKGRN